MDIPELVTEHLGGEELKRGVMLGDDDVVCITPTRTLLYRADGLLSDESVTEYPHDVDRLQLKEGRRKTKFVLEYVEDTRSFTVPNDVVRDVLGLVMEGILSVEGILGEGEGVTGAFRFSELTFVVCENRAVKHVGNSVWEEDFEMFAYEDLTGLEFEKASVATTVVFRIDGRPQRIKAPNDQARIAEQTVKKAVFEHFGVTSMDELDRHFEAEAAAREEAARTDTADGNGEDVGLEGGGGIDPLVDEGGSDGDGPFADSLLGSGGDSDSTPDSGPAAPAADDWDESPSRSERRQSERRPAESSTGGRDPAVVDESALTREDMDEVMAQLTELTEAVNRQNELLRNQQQAITQLVKELRQGR